MTQVSEGLTEFEVVCPATGEVVGTVPEHRPADIAQRSERLRAAQPEWEEIGPRERAKWLHRWRDWLMDDAIRILGLVQQETGKSWGDTNIELLAATQTMNYFADHAEAFLADRATKSWGIANITKRLEVLYRPYPLVGVILPWNYPIAMPFLDIPAALMAGAAVLSKPSEFTPLAWSAAVAGWREIGAPDVLDVVTGHGSTGAAVVDAVDMVMFTGSATTGRKIGAQAGARLIPASLELGGKDPMIVLADADIDRAVAGAIWGGFFNAGQTCVSVERVYVEEPVYEEFVSKLTAQVADLRQGMDGQSVTADVGAMANAKQLEIVKRHVEDAVAKGAKVAAGGTTADEGLFYRPTVLLEVDHSMACMREETFGPTLPVMKVPDAAEAVRLANDSEYGLSASVWTRDAERGRAIARQLDAGGVNINNVMMNVFQFPVPMQGWGCSGVGSRHGGANGVLKYCRSKAVVSEKISTKRELQWYPYTARKVRIQQGAAKLLGARDWRRKLGLRSS
ncbi:MAG: aldehyde dehydrogenase family protein [Mycobacterium sp.]